MQGIGLAGDEVGAVVIEVTSNSVRAGFAGDDCPKCVFPTAYGELQSSKQRQFVIGHDVSHRRDSMEIKSPLEMGIVTDWEVFEAMWSRAFNSILGIDSSEHPLLVPEPAHNSQKAREKILELAFEKFLSPAFFLAKDAVCTAFASGRSSALVLDCGAQLTSAVAVHEGYALLKSALKTGVAGDVVSDYLQNILESEPQKFRLRPHCTIRRKEKGTSGDYETINIPDILVNTRPSYIQYMVRRIVDDMKESLCRVSESTFREEDYASMPPVKYELPDGTSLDVASDRFRVSEILFNPSLSKTSSFVYGASGATDVTGASLPGGQSIGIPKLIVESIIKCDADIRRDLFSNVLLAGGTTLMPGFVERLSTEVSAIAPTFKVKTIAPSLPVERRLAAWIGGSILGSLASFHQLWVSKSDYDEHGTNIVTTHCP